MSISEDQYRIMQMRLGAQWLKNHVRITSDAPVELESPLQEECIAYAKSKGWWTLWSRMDLRTTTPLGTPDLIVFADRGRVFIVEAKTRKGKLRPAQLGVKIRLESLGHTVHVVRSLREFVEATSQTDLPAENQPTGGTGGF